MDQANFRGASHFVPGLYPMSAPLFGELPHKAAPQETAVMVKKDASKPRGRMSAYAYFVQTCREEHRNKHPNENVAFAEFSRKCAERWRGMSDKEKKLFQDMAERDKKRYEAEMATYKPGKGCKRTKDPNAPKRALSAFFWFCQDERSKVKALNPGLTVCEIAKELGKRWNEVLGDTKSKYEAMAQKDKARYEVEIEAYKGKKVKRSSPAKVAPIVHMPIKKQPEYEDDDDESGDDDEGEDDYESGEDE